MSYTSAIITTRTAYRLGIAPATAPDRRRAALRKLRTGHATLAAVAEAWYRGDVAAARAEIYEGRKRR